MGKFEKVMFHLLLQGERTSLPCDKLQGDSPNERVSPLQQDQVSKGALGGCPPKPHRSARGTPASCSRVLLVISEPQQCGEADKAERQTEAREARGLESTERSRKGEGEDTDRDPRRLVSSSSMLPRTCTPTSHTRYKTDNVCLP